MQMHGHINCSIMGIWAHGSWKYPAADLRQSAFTLDRRTDPNFFFGIVYEIGANSRPACITWIGFYEHFLEEEILRFIPDIRHDPPARISVVNLNIVQAFHGLTSPIGFAVLLAGYLTVMNMRYESPRSFSKSSVLRLRVCKPNPLRDGDHDLRSAYGIRESVVGFFPYWAGCRRRMAVSRRTLFAHPARQLFRLRGPFTAEVVINVGGLVWQSRMDRRKRPVCETVSCAVQPVSHQSSPRPLDLRLCPPRSVGSKPRFPCRAGSVWPRPDSFARKRPQIGSRWMPCARLYTHSRFDFTTTFILETPRGLERFCSLAVVFRRRLRGVPQADCTRIPCPEGERSPRHSSYFFAGETELVRKAGNPLNRLRGSVG